MAQLRHRPGRWALLVAGVALAAAIPVVAAGAGQSVAARTVRTTVQQMSPGDRTITVVSSGTIYSRTQAASINTLVRSQLAQLSRYPVRRELVFHQLTQKGATFFLGATDDLRTAVRVTSGRLPRSCTPQRCEVVAVGGSPATLAPAVASLGLVVVGQAVRTDPTVLSGQLDPGSGTILLGDGADAVSQLEPLSLFARTYGWVTNLDLDRVIALGVPTYVRRSSEIADNLINNIDGAAIVRPDEQLTNQYDRASLSARRFGLLGGTAAVLLLGFALVAAVSLRREHAVLVAVLRRRGARIAGVGAVTALEAGAACLAGAVLGAVLGSAVTAALADGANIPAWRTIWHALGSAWPAMVLLLLAATAVTAAVLMWPDRDRRTVWRTVELIGVACLGAAWLGASRGSTSLADGNDPFVAALPVLAAVVGGLVAAHLWAPLARLAARLVPRGSVAGRIGLLGAIRRPLRPVATTAFLTAAVASVVFAGAYRATLLNGAIDQAAYQVPLDATVTGGRDVVTPLAVTSTSALDAAAPNTRAYGVVRTSGVVRPLDGSTEQVEMLGLDDAAMRDVRRWSQVTGTSDSAATVAGRLRAPVPAPAPPVTARAVTLDVTGLSPAVDVLLWLTSGDGRDAAVELQRHGTRLTGTVPAGSWRPLAITLNENTEYATHHQHAIGEGNTDQPIVAGTITFGAAPWNWAGWGSANSAAGVTGNALRVSYRLEGSQIVLVPNYTPPPELPVAVDPATAAIADHGRLTITLDEVTVIGRVVATLPRFPTTNGPFVVADRQALSAVVDASQPGTGATGEIWIASPEAARITAPFHQLTVTLRAPIQQRLTDDPVASGSRLLLALLAGLALLVAGVAVVLLVLGDRRDDAGELHAWEADGVRPATLRRMLFLRAASVVAVALPFGLVTGLVLAQVGANLVAVDASGVVPVPPLSVSIGAAWTALLLLAGLGLAVALAAAVASRMLREHLPAPPELDLR